MTSSVPPTPAPSPPAPPVAEPDRRSGSVPRVSILGDSIAWTLGRYWPSRPGLAVTSRGVPGCGIARLPDIRYVGFPHPNYPGCTRWDRRWRKAVAADNPDVAVILLDRWELMDRRLHGRYQHVGEPDYDAYLTRELDLAITVAAGHGARVALLTAPYTQRKLRPDGGLFPEDRPERVDAWNRLLAAVAARHPAHPVVLDLRRVVCPQGRFTWTVGTVRVRSDGLHFTPRGVQKIIAPWLTPRLLRLARTGAARPG
jgi:SGNH domain (fused to AT3 domains)